MLHNFLKHYGGGKTIFFYFNIKKSGNITTHEIMVGSHGNFYDFSNSEEVANDFLNNVRSKFKASDSVMIKCGFSVENIQLGPSEYNVPILNVRYWTTEPYKTIFFNYFIFFILKDEILEKVINNGMSGSLWRFNKFIYFNLKFLKEEFNLIR